MLLCDRKEITYQTCRRADFDEVFSLKHRPKRLVVFLSFSVQIICLLVLQFAYPLQDRREQTQLYNKGSYINFNT